MVSISRQVPYGDVIDGIGRDENIAIISCNACANYCRTGGRRALRDMTSRLEADGYKVLFSEVVPKACILANLRNLALPDSAGTVLVMACVSGVRAVRRMFPSRRVVPTNETLGVGYYDASRRGSVLVSPYPGHHDEVGRAFPGKDSGGAPK